MFQELKYQNNILKCILVAEDEFFRTLAVTCMKKVIQGQCLVQLMTIEDMMPDPSPVMLGEMNLYLYLHVPLILL